MKSKIKKSIILVAVAMLSMMLLVACGAAQDPQPRPNGETPVENGALDEPNGQDPDDEIIDPTPEVESRTVTVYYVNNEYIMTGNEDLESVLPLEVQVSIGEKSVAERVVEELQREPQDENMSTELTRLTVLSVDTVDDTVFVNFANQDLQGGSLQEGMVLQQLVNSLTDLEGIDKVQILVEGSKVETLMGHYTIDEPLTR